MIFLKTCLKKAKEKIKGDNVLFLTADISKQWPFEKESFDLVTCNLILEHVEKLDMVFQEAASALRKGGYFFVSELHPFKQYQGSKARFEQNAETVIVECFTHHISEFFDSAVKNNFTCLQLKEWFDNDDKKLSPRLVTFLFSKK